PSAPAPVVFVFAKDVTATLTDENFGRVAWQLQETGFVAISMDLPCHGEDQREGEPPRLEGWAWRIRHGDALSDSFLPKVRAVVDYLVRRKVADPARIATYGVSRGGFIAMHVAAADPRFRAVAAFAPVTDLARLTEFRGLENNSIVQ